MQRSKLDVSGILDGARLVVLGGTGFLGKLFWSMLLDRYPNVGRVFLVVRAKGGMSPEARFWNDVATAEALSSLRRTLGAGFDAFLRDKVVPIDGDMGRSLCGIDPALVAELKSTIAAVVNVAGMVDFNPPLDEALEANAFGAQNLVTLAQALGGVPILHTSTCYVAGTRRGLIREEHPCAVPFPRAGELGAEVWDPNREIVECLDLVAQADHRCDDAFRQSDFAERARKSLLSRGEPVHGPPYDRELARIKRKFVCDRLVEAGLDRATHWGWPNIYTYTKAIGEQVIARSGLPFAICRPACCESTLAYPEPAYNEGVSTSAMHAYLIMKGEPQILGKHVPLDFIPADYVVAGMILALVELAEGSANPVYQFGAADVNPCTVQRFGELMGLYKRRHYRQKSSGNLLWNALQARYEPVFVDRARFDALGAPAVSRATRELASWVRKVAPGFGAAAKALDRVANREGKIAEIQEVFAPFTTTQLGPFDCSNTRAAFARLSSEDKAKLPWAPESIDWAHWMMNIHMPAMEKRIIPEMDRRLKKAPQPLAPYATLVALVDEMAERHDLALALQRMTDDGLTRTTFRDVRERAWSTAARLARLGVKKGDRVALAAHNDPDWAIAYFGILRAGATVVPVDPALDSAAWGNVLAESGARVVFWNDTVKDRSDVAAARPELIQLDLRAATERDARLVPPDVAVDASDVACLIYTSGTTGRPKGVMLTHGNFTSLVAALSPIFPLSQGDAVLSVVPLHHTFELTCGLLLPFSRGARIVYLGDVSGDRIARGLRTSRATALVGVPALWQLLERRILIGVDARGPIARAAFDVAAEANRLLANVGVDAGKVLFGAVHASMGGRMKWLISGGAALPSQTRQFFDSLGLRLTQGYGLTEAAPVLTVARPSQPPQTGVGEPVPGVELKIANPDERGIGEVLARGPNVMIGYTDVQATQATIDVGGWLHTGDLGRIDKRGRLEIVGRLKDVVITPTGENVYPEDVERRLGAVAFIAELAVVGIELGGAERLACMAVVAGENGVEHPGGLEAGSERNERAHRALRNAFDELPLAHRPGIVHLTDAALPRTTTRKIRRDEVRAVVAQAMAASTPPEQDAAALSGVHLAIAAVKGIPIDHVTGRATIYGDLGFDSLLLTELLGALEARFGQVDAERLQACVTVADVEVLVRGGSLRAAVLERSRKDVSASPMVLPAPIQELGRAFVGKLQDVFYGDVMKPRVLGRAHIPYNRNVIVVANHASHLDMGFVRHALGTYGEDIVALAAQDYFFGSGLKRAFFENLTNLKAVDRKASLRQAAKQASDVIERGKTVLVFPEGTRSETGEIGEFKPLVGSLALDHGVDVLPMFLGGTHAAMPRGAKLPIRRDIVARIGPVLRAADLRRLTAGMSQTDAAREAARMVRAAVLALSEGKVLDLASSKAREDLRAAGEHPLVKLFSELEAKFCAGEVEKPVSYYVSLGNHDLAKWTVRVDANGCDVRPGKPEGGLADCVLKTSPELFAKIVRESYIPSPADFLSGAIKSNDVALLVTFQKVFQLDSGA